jgi:hypothetical protein
MNHDADRPTIDRDPARPQGLRHELRFAEAPTRADLAHPNGISTAMRGGRCLGRAGWPWRNKPTASFALSNDHHPLCGRPVTAVAYFLQDKANYISIINCLVLFYLLLSLDSVQSLSAGATHGRDWRPLPRGRCGSPATLADAKNGRTISGENNNGISNSATEARPHAHNTRMFQPVASRMLGHPPI